jgi:hypothetical protein
MTLFPSVRDFRLETFVWKTQIIKICGIGSSKRLDTLRSGIQKRFRGDSVIP